MWVACVLACELRNVPLTLKQHSEIKAVIVLRHIHGGLFNESLKSIWSEHHQTVVLHAPKLK